ncbi:MAG: SDR family oxidoreductase [Candidatus Nitrosocosmicus sp.]|nr:SDR family oxidoreductase [Candidatus Nitrosocosmicus sp.]MDN5866668.1 SDR family oxidoreductase [Candidatus Nitrosocosmicus sp.]
MNDIGKKGVVIITGCSSGIGFETSLFFARNNFKTYATMRNLEKSPRLIDIAESENLSLEVLQLDVNDDNSIRNVIEHILFQEGGIDILVNNAGVGLVSSVQDTTLEETKEIFETNFFGVIRTTLPILEIMKRQKSGIIVNVTSVAGKVGGPLFSSYCSTKFALEGWTESLKFEIESLGIKAILIEPGFVKTDLLNSALMRKKRDKHSIAIEEMINGLQEKMKKGIEPIKVAEGIMHAVLTDSPDTRYVIGDDAISFIKMRQKLPDSEFEEYAKSEFKSTSGITNDS